MSQKHALAQEIRLGSPDRFSSWEGGVWWQDCTFLTTTGSGNCALIRLFIVLMNIVPNPQLVCTQLWYKSSSMVIVLSVERVPILQGWLGNKFLEPKYFCSSLWAKEEPNANIVWLSRYCHVTVYSWHLVPQTPPTREGLVTSSWYLGLQ